MARLRSRAVVRCGPLGSGTRNQRSNTRKNNSGTPIATGRCDGQPVLAVAAHEVARSAAPRRRRCRAAQIADHVHQPSAPAPHHQRAAARARRRLGSSRASASSLAQRDPAAGRQQQHSRCRTGSSRSAGRRRPSRCRRAGCRRSTRPATSHQQQGDGQLGPAGADGRRGAIGGSLMYALGWAHGRRGRGSGEGAPRAAAAPMAGSVARRKPASFISTRCDLFVLAEPVDEARAGQRGRVEGALVHELLPLGQRAHLLEQVDVERRPARASRRAA